MENAEKAEEMSDVIDYEFDNRILCGHPQFIWINYSMFYISFILIYGFNVSIIFILIAENALRIYLIIIYSSSSISTSSFFSSFESFNDY